MTEQTSKQHSAKPKLIAFYLPQFHPIPENDQWWGAGFTEWTNVARATPQFRGHYQPHLPADTGFYDLRLPETRQLQAELARKHGIFGFCYYHYWFNGQRLLERPFNDVLQSGAPNFPFCLCWANENWTRKWDGKQDQIILRQTYSPQDDQAHIQWLLRAFTDPRYIKVDGKPLFLFYRASRLPDIKRTVSLWREAAAKFGLPGLYLCRVQSFPEEYGDPAAQGLDAAVEFRPNCADTPRLRRGIGWDILRACQLTSKAYGTNSIFSYQDLVKYCLTLPEFAYRKFPCVTPSWDNTARRANIATIFKDANPSDYQMWLENVLKKEMSKQLHPSFVFVNAWNEWAEGNHLEPCQKWGRRYLEATRAAVEQVCGQLPSEFVEQEPEMGSQSNYLPTIDWIRSGIRKNRNVLDGYTRGWGLQFCELRHKVLADPLYEKSLKLAGGRSVQAESCRMNLFLILKYYLSKLDFGHIVEFGAYKGGSAIFMAAVCRELYPDVRVYSFDTFQGMPVTDRAVDAHGVGDFHDVDLDELQRYVASVGLSNLEFVKGTFEEMAPAKLEAIESVALAHIDCDIKASVAYSYEVIKPRMVDGGYIIFDDAHTSSCIGATEAVEDLVIRRDQLNSEQIWPHFVFRAFRQSHSR